MAIVLAALALAGCAHKLPPMEVVGQTHAPYTGKPAYLDEAAPPRYAGRGWPGGQVAGPRALPAGERRERLRALLAAVDAHSVSVETLGDVRALQLTADEIVELVRPWPDLNAEADELRHIVTNLPKLPPKERDRARARMNQLTDLLRLQLLAGNGD
jgi:hypothetical protein